MTPDLEGVLVPEIWIAVADTTMLLAADAGYLFHSPPNVQAEFPQLPALDEFDDLLAAITGHLANG